jgi:glycerophosphoryl diester phosphodiesterase
VHAKLGPVIQIFAHRGLHVVERENTLASFRAAVALGVDGVELDVRRCADGAFVVHHDPVIDGRPIIALSATDLPGHVPTLGEAMEACAGVTVNVEIKNIRHPSEPTYDETGDFARGVVDHLRDGGWTEAALISCFDLDTCTLVRDIAPELYVGWLVDWVLDTQQSLLRAHEVGLNAIHPFFKRLDAATAARAHDLGVDLNVWTVNAPADIVAMAALDVASIISDDPATAIALTRDLRPSVHPCPMP